jgi:DNA replication protein DnaC
MLKNLTLLGMSGVGKTYLATLLNQENSYYHYGGDYRLGQ